MSMLIITVLERVCNVFYFTTDWQWDSDPQTPKTIASEVLRPSGSHWFKCLWGSTHYQSAFAT